MEKYLRLIDDIIIDFLTDIKSLRYQLVLGAFALVVYLFKHGADVLVQTTSLGLLTLVYGLYFQSKKHQAEMEAQKAPEVDDVKNTNRNPDI